MTTENSDFSRRSMLGLTTGAAISAAMPSISQAAAGVRPSDIVLMDAVALSSAIHSRQVSCVEVMTAYLDHIDKLNPKVNAIVALRKRSRARGWKRIMNG
jgi:amidase